MYTYRPGSTGTPGQHPPIRVIFMAAMRRVLPSPSRFCMVEAPAKEWLFNDALVPWILLAGYRNPNETVPDFPDDDNEAGGSLGKGSGSAPLTGASAEVTAVDGVEEDDRFETVDDGKGEPGDKVVISIPAKEVAKSEGSGLAGKTLMFESEEEDDPKLKKQIEAALDKTGLLGELMLLEHEDESEPESSDDNRRRRSEQDQVVLQGSRGGDWRVWVENEQSQSCEHQPCCRTGECQKSNRFQARRPIRKHPTDQTRMQPRARVPAVSVPAKLLLPNYNFQPQPKGYKSTCSPLSSVWLPWHRLQVWKRIPSAAWKTILVD